MPALEFGSKNGSPKVRSTELNFCSVICQGKLQIYCCVGLNSITLAAQISIN